jgi:hypothetical protein
MSMMANEHDGNPCVTSRGTRSVQAYDKLLLKDAGVLLKCNTQQELLAFCNAQSWRHDGQYVYFAHAEGKAAGQENVDVFHNMLLYSRELDRII